MSLDKRNEARNNALLASSAMSTFVMLAASIAFVLLYPPLADHKMILTITAAFASVVSGLFAYGIGKILMRTEGERNVRKKGFDELSRTSVASSIKGTLSLNVLCTAGFCVLFMGLDGLFISKHTFFTSSVDSLALLGLNMGGAIAAAGTLAVALVVALSVVLRNCYKDGGCAPICGPRLNNALGNGGLSTWTKPDYAKPAYTKLDSRSAFQPSSFSNSP